MNKALLISALIVLGALTGYSLVHYGGLFAWLAFYTRDPASWQIFADLVITMCLLLACMRRDAQANGRPFVPWAVFSLATGAFGPLLYFMTAQKRTTAAPSASP